MRITQSGRRLARAVAVRVAGDGSLDAAGAGKNRIAAMAALTRFMKAWNSHDMKAVTAAIHYPHASAGRQHPRSLGDGGCVRHGNGTAAPAHLVSDAHRPVAGRADRSEWRQCRRVDQQARSQRQSSSAR
jgi:hypothetical protein